MSRALKTQTRAASIPPKATTFNAEVPNASDRAGESAVIGRAIDVIGDGVPSHALAWSSGARARLRDADFAPEWLLRQGGHLRNKGPLKLGIPQLL